MNVNVTTNNAAIAAIAATYPIFHHRLSLHFRSSFEMSGYRTDQCCQIINLCLFQPGQCPLINKSAGCASEHRLQIHCHIVERFRPENDPADDHEKHRINMPPPTYSLFQICQLFHCQQNEIEKSPQKEREIGPVPDTGQHPDHKQVEYQSASAFSPAAAKRKIHIIAEPGLQ